MSDEIVEKYFETVDYIKNPNSISPVIANAIRAGKA